MIAFCRLTGLLLLAAGIATTASADPFVGIVKLTEGDVVIQRNGQTLMAGPGTQVLPLDCIETGSRGSAGVVLSDDTRLSLGADSSIVIVDYQFEPFDTKLSFILRIIRGTVSYLSGQISKLAPDSVELIVPDATIGVRGTHVLIKVN